MKVVIMAGGKGTRIASINSEVPKPMISILGKPILEYQIECLKKQNIVDIILVIGHLGNIIKEYFGTGNEFGVNIQYIEEKEPLGTAGALYFMRELLNEDFLLINGDIIFDIDIHKFYNYHIKNRGSATLFTHPNSHPYDSALIEVDDRHKVTRWLHKEDERTWYQNRVNAGLHIISPNVFSEFISLKKRDLDRDILKPLIKKGKLFAYDSPEYVKDMGTPERYFEVIEDIKSGRVEASNLTKKQKAIFLDRDGTINKYVGFLRKIEDFELIDGVADAIKSINRKGYLAIVITNQPVVARGELTVEELNNIHKKMETLLGEKGAFLNDIFYCPHHPDKGFEGERKEYKIKCTCRKPHPGLILEAAKKYNISLKDSYMIGDSMIDMEAGKAAGCKCILLDKDSTKKYDNSIKVYHNLLEFVTKEI